MFEFKTINSKSKEWSRILQKSHAYDFYHTAFYHNLDEEGEGVMLYAANQNDFIALPVIIRKIDGTIYSDATSVYGYCGPIARKEIKEIDDNLLEYLKDKINEYFKENNIIAAFSRLHPLIEQSDFFKDFGEVIELNKTVSIDLTLPADIQRRAFRKSLKSDLNQLRKRKGYSSVVAESDDEINQFIDIYYETMDRVEATPDYYFSKEYFHNFLKNEEFSNKLLLAMKDDVITAGAIFTVTGNIMQYHLAGTKGEYGRDTPMKLLVDEARLLGTKLGLTDLHLGGGVGGQDNDSLFHFKSGYSKNLKQFSIWKKIFNQEMYDNLVKEKGLENSDSGFFPLYRLK